MHNRRAAPSMKITVEQSNNNSNDQWRKDNMTYILPGEGEANIITILSIFCQYFNLIRTRAMKELILKVNFKGLC